MSDNKKSAWGAKQAFSNKADDKMRHLPKQARDECAKIDAYANEVKKRWQARQNCRFKGDVAQKLIQLQSEHSGPAPSPSGMRDMHSQNMTKAKLAITHRNQGQLNALDNASRKRQNAISKKYGVTLHPPDKNIQKQSPSRSTNSAKESFLKARKHGVSKTNFNTAAKGRGR